MKTIDIVDLQKAKRRRLAIEWVRRQARRAARGVSTNAALAPDQFCAHGRRDPR